MACPLSYGTTHLRRKASNSVAFSLIELLAIIAIIGLLAALSLVAFSRARQRALQIQCANNVRQLAIGLQAFVTDNNNAYPLAIAPLNTGGHFWLSALQYAEFNFPGNSNQMTFNAWTGQSVWKCPAANTLPPWPTSKHYFSYGYNALGMEPGSAANGLGLGGHTWNASTHLFAGFVHESEVASPAEMMAIGDGMVGNNGIVLDGDLFLWRAATVTNYTYPGCTQRAFALHRGKANVVFCDGHVESPTLQFLFADTSDQALNRWNRDHNPHRELLSP